MASSMGTGSEMVEGSASEMGTIMVVGSEVIGTDTANTAG